MISFFGHILTAITGYNSSKLDFKYFYTDSFFYATIHSNIKKLQKDRRIKNGLKNRDIVAESK